MKTSDELPIAGGPTGLLSRSHLEDLLKSGETQPIPGAHTLADYQEHFLSAARAAHDAAPPEVQAARPLDIPFIKHFAGRLYRQHHGTVK
jgi:hypothetical protein